jgi:hypothetical protein
MIRTKNNNSDSDSVQMGAQKFLKCYYIFMYKLNKTLICFLIITLVGSFFTYQIVVKAYDNAYANYNIQ